MKYLSIVFKNIQKFIKHKPFLFTFLIISQVVCVIAMIFVCCIIDNAYRSEKVINEGLTEFYIGLCDLEKSDENLIYTDGEGKYFYSDGTPISNEKLDEVKKTKYPEGYYIYDFKSFKPKMDEIIEFLGDDFSSATIIGEFDDTQGSLTFSAGISLITDNEISSELKKFRNSNENILRLDPKNYEDVFGETPKIDEKVNINGTVYTVKMIEDDVAFFDIPYAAIQDDFPISAVWIRTKDVCSSERCYEIGEKTKALFETKDSSKPEPRVLEELQNVNMAYTVSVAVIIMLLLNISRVYSYVLNCRKKRLAVMSICGASKGKLFVVYFVELIITLLATYGIGVLIFHTLLLPFMGTIFPNFLKFISPSVYLTLFGIYMTIALIIMTLTISKFIIKSSVQMERSGK